MIEIPIVLAFLIIPLLSVTLGAIVCGQSVQNWWIRECIRRGYMDYDSSHEFHWLPPTIVKNRLMREGQ